VSLTGTASRAPVTPATRPAWPLWKTLLLALLGLVVLLSITRVVTGADDITSGGAIRTAIEFAVPIGLAGLGGLWSERAGVVNIGLEGMLILGTWFGAWGALQFHNPWAGVVAGAIGGALGGLLHAIATVTFGVDHIISGVAIVMLGQGATQYLSRLVFVGMPGGGETQSPRLPAVDRIGVPGIGGPLETLEGKHWFLLSDLAGVLRGLTESVSLFTIVAVLLVPLSFYVLWRTAFGLRLRSCGERPVAAESLGVNVYLYKYIAVIMSGVLAGLGGAFLSIVAAGIYREGQTGGRGFIGLAAMIFGNWRPGGLAGGALLFGYTDALQLRQGGTSVHALLLTVALLLVAFAVYQFVRQERHRAALITGACAIVVFVVFAVTDTVPDQFTSFTPHLATLLVLSLAAQRLRMPAADGLPYRKGMAT
jgi:simple sugar transport system permease protein